VTRVLILGGTGMLGHKLWQVARERFETFVMVRGGPERCAEYGLFDPRRTIEGVSAEDFGSVIEAVAEARPDVVVNCVGIVKQRAAANDPIANITVNALFPHQVARLCQGMGARLIHLSTDCVFSGRRGGYSEADEPDPNDQYGRAKLLGEVSSGGCLTLRSSLIGRELGTCQGLLEWFLSQRGGTVRGFRRAIFSGLTTAAMARIICEIVERHPHLEGVWHVASEPISKLDLLLLIREALHLDVRIEPDDSAVIDRSLDDRRFREATGMAPPSWPAMIAELAADPSPYRSAASLRCPAEACGC
jgi:dTDP-4-dehydrorhamnose reductase